MNTIVWFFNGHEQGYKDAACWVTDIGTHNSEYGFGSIWRIETSTKPTQRQIRKFKKLAKAK